jgi:hypothetical protein
MGTQPFFTRAFAALNSKPCLFGGAATLGFCVVVGASSDFDFDFDLDLGFRASAFGGAAELRLPSVVVVRLD